MSPLVSILGGATIGTGVVCILFGDLAGIGLISAGVAIWVVGWR